MVRFLTTMIYIKDDFFSFVKKENLYAYIPNDIDLCLSSPPLAILEEKFLAYSRALREIMNPDGLIVLQAPPRFLPMFRERVLSPWKVRDYGFHRSKGFNNNEISMMIVLAHERTPLPPMEDMEREFFRATDDRIAGKPIFEYDYEREAAHRCEFCPAFIDAFLLYYTQPDDIVIDTFCGTGTVPGQAEKLGRWGIGIDVRDVENIHSDYEVGAPYEP